MAHPDAPRYEDLELLGRGGFGKVYRARDRLARELVALKTLEPRGIAPDDLGPIQRRFVREAQVMAAVRHPHLLRILDADPEASPPYLVMELVQGRDLEVLLRRGPPFSPDRVVALARELGSALDALHDAGILHRDLKPSNVMIRDGEGSAVLMDLGLAKVEDETALTATGRVVGTPRYMPPEVLAGRRWTEAGDHYQLALVLWEAAYGAPRFQATSLAELSEKVLSGRGEAPPPDSPIPAHMHEVLMRGMDVDPELRFLRGGDLAAALAAPEPAPSPAATRTVALPRSVISDSGIPRPPTSSLAPGVAAGGLLACLAAGGVGAWSAPTPGPMDLRVSVVADAVVASYRAGSPPGMQLEVGDLRITEEETTPEGRRLVARGLPAGEPADVRVRWPGGAGARLRLEGRPPPVLPRVEFGPRGRIAVELRRPAALRVAGAWPAWTLLGQGPAAIPAPTPLPTELVLEWEEDGIPGELRVPLEEWVDGEARRLRNGLLALGLEDRLAAAQEGAPPEVDDATRLLAPLLGWLPSLLRAGSLPRDLRRRLRVLGEEAARLPALVRAFEGAPAPPAMPPGHPGILGLGRTDLGTSRSLELLPLGGEDPVTRTGITITSREGKRSPFDKYREAAAEIRTRWPEDAPGTVERLVALEVRLGRLKRNSQLVIRSGAGSPGEFRARIWAPFFPPGTRAVHRRDPWVHLTLPADLAPRPGEELVIEVTSLAFDELHLAKVREVRAAW